MYTQTQRQQGISDSDWESAVIIFKLRGGVFFLPDALNLRCLLAFGELCIFVVR